MKLCVLIAIGNVHIKGGFSLVVKLQASNLGIRRSDSDIPLHAAIVKLVEYLGAIQMTSVRVRLAAPDRLALRLEMHLYYDS